MARSGRNPTERPTAAGEVRSLGCGQSLRLASSAGGSALCLHQRRDTQGSAEAHGLFRIRKCLHTGEPARRAHGFFRRSLLCVLPVPPAQFGDYPMNPLTCPLPVFDTETILMGHGGGGRLSADLFRNIFLPAFGNSILGR